MPEAQDADVLVVGAGPTGLAVAAELALAGVGAVVLDALAERSGQSKALALQPRSAELLDARGWLDPLRPHMHAFLPTGHFAGLPLDYSVLETPFPHQIAVEQARIEELLEGRIATPVQWAHACTAIRQGPGDVTATVETPAGTREFTARCLVAADGAHSTVRRLLGAAFPGRGGPHAHGRRRHHLGAQAARAGRPVGSARVRRRRVRLPPPARGRRLPGPLRRRGAAVARPHGPGHRRGSAAGPRSSARQRRRSR